MAKIKTDLDHNSQLLQYNNICLGIDTEMLLLNGKKVLWPDALGFPQERNPGSNKCGRGANHNFDFHGDGFATELCTSRPHSCLEMMLETLRSSLGWLEEKKKITAFEAPSVYAVPEAVVTKASDDAKKLGCMPSLNVYGDAGIPGGLGEYKRTTGCHLHMSHPVLVNHADPEELAANLVKWSDILVANTWTYISPEDPEVQAERRQYYGRAGEYRLKIYPHYPVTTTTKEYSVGVEYRVLPGWVLKSPVYLTLMFHMYRCALHEASKYGAPDVDLTHKAVHAINTANQGLAAEVIAELELPAEMAFLLKSLNKTALNPTLEGWKYQASRSRGYKWYAEEEM